MFGDLVNLDFQQPQFPDMSNWDFSVATPQDMQPYFDPYTNDPGFNFLPGGGTSFNFGQSGQTGGGFGVSPQSPMFNPASVGPPPSGGPVPMGGSAPSTPPMGSNTAAATPPIGAPGPGGADRAGSAPRTGAGGAGPMGTSAFRPGSASQPTPPPQQGAPQGQSQDFDWKKMLGGIGQNVVSSGTQALVGGGLGLLGRALASSPSQPNQGGGSASAPRPTPPPTTPTGTPNMGQTPPLPGAQWSPLLMKQGQPQVEDAAGLEAQKRMRRGGQTGGMALY